MKKKNWFKEISAWVFIIIVIYALYVWVSKSNENLEENKRYTTGYFFRTSWSGGLVIDYECYIDGEKHIGGARYNMDYNLLLGRRFFVKFSSDNYSNHKLLINMPVPDTVREPPLMGWNAIEFKQLFGEEK